MINFEEELKKFHPSLEINQSEDAIYSKDLTDMADLFINLVTEDYDDAAGQAVQPMMQQPMMQQPVMQQPMMQTTMMQQPIMQNMQMMPPEQ